ncbi:MAG: hypothetical protein HFG26_01390 [Provencibacterium sp.]|nr:hypothetical protein [Provencibacterium sp.]
MVKRILAAFLSGLSLFSLTGCSLPPATVEELMRAPKLTEEQAAVNHALSAALGTDNYQLKYPLSGSYRSAYVFYDVDGDDVQEALVFYQPRLEDSGVRMNVLDYQNGEWSSIYDVSGEGSGDVDYITFENIESNEYKNIIIGWQPENASENLMAIYTFEENRLNTRFDERYSQFIIRDFDNDGLMDIVTISMRRNRMTLITADPAGRIEASGTLALSQDIKSIEQMLFGRLSGSGQAIFLDVLLDRSTYATEIVSIEKGSLIPLIDLAKTYTQEGEDPTAQQAANFRLTQRQEPILSTDLDHDGVIEVPSSRPLLGYEIYDELDGEPMYLTTFSVFKENELIPVYNACVNVEAGYLIKIPERWEDRVTVISEGNPNQWNFVEYRESLNDLSNELLRINRVSRNDTQDRFERNQILLGTSQGLYRFYGYIPPTQNAELELSEAELREMFVLL